MREADAQAPEGVTAASIQAERSSEVWRAVSGAGSTTSRAVGERDRRRRGGHDHVGRPAQPFQAAPDAFGQGRVVVTGQQHPGPREATHGRQRLDDGALGDEIAVERVAGDQHRRHLVPGRELGDPPHRLEPGLAQQRRHVARKVVERLAELPVGGVEQAQGHQAIRQRDAQP